jgi:hypothetical protein
MKVRSFGFWLLIFLAAVILGGGLAFSFWPAALPPDQYAIIHDAAAPYDTVIIYNPGGWGNATLEESTDFAPILNGIQQTLTDTGYRALLIAYTRTPGGLSGMLSDFRELLISFPHAARLQAEDVRKLSADFPDKQFILVGYSNGGGLTNAAMPGIAEQPNVCSIVAGAPGWVKTYRAANALVLDNNGQDRYSALDVPVMFWTLIKAPFVWIKSKITGHSMKLAFSLEFPGHVYEWSAEEVGPPIVKFLQGRFPAR